MPGPAVLALALGTSAHPMTMGLAVLPAPAEGASVVEVKSAPAHAGGRHGGARGGGGWAWAPHPCAPGARHARHHWAWQGWVEQ